MLYKTFPRIILLLIVVATLRADENALDTDFSIGGGLYELEIEPQNASGKVGETVTFMCKDKNSELRDEQFEWSKDGVLVGSGQKFVKVITSKDDAGEYKCEASDSVVVTHLTVTDDNNTAPKLHTTTRRDNDDRINIICSFNSHPLDSNQYTFEWLDKSGERISNLPNDVMKIDDLRNKQPLTCRAIHRNGNILQAGLTFESIISPSQMVVHNVQAFMEFDRTPLEGEPLILSNRFAGDYDRIVGYVWKKDGRVIGTEPSYKIQVLDDNAKGIYTCDITLLLDSRRTVLQTTLNLNNSEEEEDDDDFTLSITPMNPTAIKLNKLMEIHCKISGPTAYTSSAIKWVFIPKSGIEMPLEGWTVELNTLQTSTIRKVVEVTDVGSYICKVGDKSARTKLIKKKSNWSVEVKGDEATILLRMTPQENRVKINDQFRFVCTLTGSTGTIEARTSSSVRITTNPIGPNQIEVIGRATEEKFTVECFVHDVVEIGTVYADCGFGQKKCPDGRCILNSAACDGNVQECDPIIRTCKIHEGKQFGKTTYNVNWECDGENDCGNGFDEAFCSGVSREICGKEYNCPNSDKKIPFAYVCDGETDCNGAADESDCSNPSIVSTVETNYKVMEGSSVTLKCEASGRPAPRIIWRYNWGCLPGQNMGDSQIPYLSETGIDRFRISSTIQNCDSNRPNVVSTLKIENFRSSDAGFYNCEAISGQKRHMSENYDVQMLRRNY